MGSVTDVEFACCESAEVEEKQDAHGGDWRMELL